MPRDPKDTSITAAQRQARRFGEAEDQKDPIRIRVGAGPAGAEGKEGPKGEKGEKGEVGSQGPPGKDGGGTIIGEIKEWPCPALPSIEGEEWKWAAGEAISRTTFETLFNRLCFNTTCTRTSGSKKLTSIPSTTNMKVGMPISGTGLTTESTITSILSSTEIEVSAAASSSGSGGTLVVAPHGVGNGTTTFNLPDKRGRVGVAPDDMGGTDAGRISTATQRLGGTGGEEKHQLTLAEIPKHRHTVRVSGADDNNHTGNFDGVADSDAAEHLPERNTSYQGEDGSHNNMQPFTNVNYIIRAA